MPSMCTVLLSTVFPYFETQIKIKKFFYINLWSSVFFTSYYLELPQSGLHVLSLNLISQLLDFMSLYSLCLAF